MNVDAESAGILIAVGFFALGFVSSPLAKWFLAGAVLFSALIALLLRFNERSYSRAAGTLVVLCFVRGIIALLLARWFLLGAAFIGGAVALLLRFSRKES
jgi:hypothetical protein